MKLAPSTADPHFPDSPPTSDDGAPSETIGTALPSGFFRWLRHFAVYMGAVLAACATGLLFLWQIPFVHELPRSLGGEGIYKPLAAAVAPLSRPTQPREPSSQPTAVPVALAGSPPAPAANLASDPDAPPTTPEPRPDAPDNQTASTETPAAPPAEEPAPPAPTPQAEIEQLLAEAQQQMDSRRITAPTSGNALSTYRRVLELQPENPVALAGIQRIAAYYQNAAEQSLRQGQPDESLSYLNRGLRAIPNDQALLSLRRETQLAKQREQEEQALREEIRRQQTERQRQEEFRRSELEAPQPWWQQPPSQESSGFNQR